ncbi:MAG: glycosyltransferase family A protein [Candidatus Bathyarchaeia archaeon]
MGEESKMVSKSFVNSGSVQIGRNEQSPLEKGLVSIIIPTYNHGRYLKGSIESALNQTYSHTEVIVIDDGSTDDTKAVVANYPVKYVFQRNQGTSTALNNGIRLSRGEFFMAMGADDLMSEDYVAKTLRLMLTNRKIGLVYTGGRFFGEREEAILPRKLYHRFSVLIGEVGVIGVALTRRTAFESAGGYDPTLVSYEDYDLAIRICLKGWKIKPVCEFLYFARKHDSEIAHRHPVPYSLKDQYFRRTLDRKFWFLQLYRRLFLAYHFLLEPFVFMVQMPKAYLSTISKNYRILNLAKLYPWHNAADRRNGVVFAKLIGREANYLLAARVARESCLIKYHLDQLTKRESDFADLVMRDASESKKT